MRVFQANQAVNAAGERSSICGDSQLRYTGSKFLQLSQRSRIDERIFASCDCHIIAAVFTLNADLPRDPPDCRVIEEQYLNQPLQKVDQIIISAYVRQFVRENSLQLLRGKTCERVHWQKHNGAEP